MNEQIQNNKRIAKNTLMLYFRMFMIMGVSLYTSRIILNVLGVEDYGIYNVVAGFVTMLSFLNNALASAIQRFYSFELGKKDFKALRKVFLMTLNIQFIFSFFIVLFAETIGLYFFYEYLNIPDVRKDSAFWVYQFSVLTLVVSMISVPYNALIIAYERMNIFAIVSGVEVFLKLFIIYTLLWFGFDKLKIYAVLMFLVALTIRLIYGIYCKKFFEVIRFKFFWDSELFKTLINYSGWNLWGNIASIIMGQGVNILLNIFFGPIVNAARGIAYQVHSAVNSFVVNFQMAINPQIIKSFASNNFTYMHQLVYQGAKYSFFLLYMISLPIILQTELMLKIWLKIVPEYSVIFTQLIVITSLIDCISGTLMTAAQASGKIKVYQTVVGSLLILNLPFSYLILKLGFEPYTVFYISIIISLIALIFRLFLLKPLIQLSIFSYMINVIFKIISVVIISFWMPWFFKDLFENDLIKLIWTSIISTFSIFITIYIFGLNKIEQAFLNNRVYKLLNFKF